MDKQGELEEIQKAFEDGIISKREYEKFTVLVSSGGSIENEEEHEVDTESTFIYSLLGFLMPYCGLFLFIYWYSSRPARSRAAGRGIVALITTGAVISLVYGFVKIFINELS